MNRVVHEDSTHTHFLMMLQIASVNLYPQSFRKFLLLFCNFSCGIHNSKHTHTHKHTDTHHIHKHKHHTHTHTHIHTTYTNTHTHKHTLNINPLNAELNPICHLLPLLGAHNILHVSRIRGKDYLIP